jgi:hypothetical protein
MLSSALFFEQRLFFCVDTGISEPRGVATQPEYPKKRACAACVIMSRDCKTWECVVMSGTHHTKLLCRLSEDAKSEYANSHDASVLRYDRCVERDCVVGEKCPVGSICLPDPVLTTSASVQHHGTCVTRV